MIYTSLALVLLAANASVSAAIPPFSHFHMHPGAMSPDTRISLTLHNSGHGFRDIKVAGHSYTILEHASVTIKAPVGTVIYADSRTPAFHRGDAMFAVTPQINQTKVEVN